MKNIKKINFLKTLAVLSIFSTLALVSCEDNLQPDYPAGRAKPLVSFESSTYEMSEGEDLFVTLVTNEVLNDDMHFQLDVVKGSSTAVDHDDFEIGLDGIDIDYGTVDSYKITFPKFESSFKFNITAFLDDLAESDEVLYIKITSKGNLNGDVNEAASMTEIKILQKSSNIVGFTFSWDKNFDFAGATYSLCQIQYDNDFIYADDQGNLLDYLAATADCPEVGEIDIDALGVGTFHIVQNVYDDGGLAAAGVSPAFSIPVTVDYSRAGSVLNGTYVQDAANAVDSNFGSDANGNNLKYVISFTINADGTVTLFDDTTSSTIATGKNKLPKFKGLDKLAKRIR
jgi:hypothetical protein